MRQGGDRGDSVDRASLAVSCEGAGYTEIVHDLPVSAITVDLSDNAIDSLGPLSRIRHVVNLRLRGNHICNIHQHPSPSSGHPVIVPYTLLDFVLYRDEYFIRKLLTFVVSSFLRCIGGDNNVTRVILIGDMSP